MDKYEKKGVGKQQKDRTREKVLQWLGDLEKESENRMELLVFYEHMYHPILVGLAEKIG